MKILIDIPNREVPKHQDIMDIHISFIDGKVSECNYPFEILQADKTDRSFIEMTLEALEALNREMDEKIKQKGERIVELSYKPDCQKKTEP